MDENMMPYNFIDQPADGLIQAGLEFKGAKVCESPTHEILAYAAMKQALYQAVHQTQGHQLWIYRVNTLRNRLPGFRFKEICAESWPWEVDKPLKVVGTSMFQSWVQSPGHWKVASKKHDLFGVGMAKGMNNIWYACIIVGDL